MPARGSYGPLTAPLFSPASSASIESPRVDFSPPKSSKKVRINFVLFNLFYVYLLINVVYVNLIVFILVLFFYLYGMIPMQPTTSATFPAPAPLAADLDQIRTAFAEELLNVKETTRVSYSRFLKSFFTWCTETGRNVAAMSARDVNAYRDYLLTRRNDDGTLTSSLTVSAYLTAVRRFYQWAEDYGYHANVAGKVKGAKRPDKYQRHHLTQSQAAQLLAYFRGDLRDYAIVNLALRTGMRTFELVNAKVGGLKKMNGRVVLYFQGKHRDHDRDFVILSEKVAAAIYEYLATERPNHRPDEPLFTSRSNRNQSGPMTTRSIRRMAAEGLKAMGLNSREYSAHSLRHTTAVTMIDMGASIEEVRAELRHKSSDTTRIYLKNIEEQHRLNRAAVTMLDNAF